MQSSYLQIQSMLASSIDKHLYNVWIAPLEFLKQKDRVCIFAPSTFMAEFLRRRFSQVLLDSVQHVFGKNVQIDIYEQSKRSDSRFNQVEHDNEVEHDSLLRKLQAPEANSFVPDNSTTLASGRAEKLKIAQKARLEESAGAGESLQKAILPVSESSSVRGEEDRQKLSSPNPRPISFQKLLDEQHAVAKQLSLPVPLESPCQSFPQFAWRYNFESFVVGSCNELAFAATRSVCDGFFDADMLFLSSSPGLGKTHLLQAAGKSLTELCNKREVKSAYLTAEDFANRFVQSIKSNSLDNFKGYFRKLDLLLLEDVHFLQNKEKTQLELLSTIKTLQDRGAKVVLTSSFSPKELRNFDEQLLSRFYSGLLSSIYRPDLQTRRMIFRKKAASYQVNLPEDVEYVLAENITSDVRQIESCLQNLLLKARLYNSSITMQMAMEIITDYTKKQKLTDISSIISTICSVYNISPNQLSSVSRKQEYVLARNLIFFLARKYTDLSLEAIGQAFNRRHSTVLKGIVSLEREMHLGSPKGRQIAQTLERIEQRNGIQSVCV